MNDNHEDEKQEKVCIQCRKRIDLGKDAICIEEGVLGFNGLVPLAELLWFCSNECVSAYYNDTTPEIAKDRRIP